MGDHVDFERVSDSTGCLQVGCASVPSRGASGVALRSTWLLARCVSGIDNQPSGVYRVGQHGQIRNLISDAVPKDEYVNFVKLLDLSKEIYPAKCSEKEQIQRQIEKTDREIDELVYKLYGITEEEKKIIEGKE